MSELASEAVNVVVHCITVWRIKRQAKEDHSWLHSLTHDRLNVALALFYQPRPQFIVLQAARLPVHGLDLREITLGLPKRVSVLPSVP